MSTSVTNEIRVSAEASYRDEYSDPNAEKFVYSYEINIENLGPRSVQLLSRKWVIFDSVGRKKNVEGQGVIGKQPVIEPGEIYTYTSWSPLHSNLGYMKGSFVMKDLVTLDQFEVRIPKFILSTPALRN